MQTSITWIVMDFIYKSKYAMINSFYNFIKIHFLPEFIPKLALLTLLYICVLVYSIAQCIFPTKNGQQYLIYNEGEQWNDGCDYTCTCKDGASGYYECISS
jgi:hypothetical protein